MSNIKNQSIAAVVLAYSRFEILQQLISALQKQTFKLDEIIVVYQGNDSKVMKWLTIRSDLTVIKQKNMGSAGGFCKGIEESIQRGHHWTWMFDDDAIPQFDALEEIVTRPYFGREETAFMGSRIVDRYGKTYMSPGTSTTQDWYGTVLEDKCIEATDACWLGLFINNNAVRIAGLPIKEFFLWDEDREFVNRLSKKGKGYCVLSSVIVHYQNESFDPFGTDFIKIAYYVRNHIARAKLSSGSIGMKILRTLKEVIIFSKRIVKKEIPLKIIPWMFRGVFLFWPKVRYFKD